MKMGLKSLVSASKPRISKRVNLARANLSRNDWQPWYQQISLKEKKIDEKKAWKWCKPWLQCSRNVALYDFDVLLWYLAQEWPVEKGQDHGSGAFLSTADYFFHACSDLQGDFTIFVYVVGLVAAVSDLFRADIPVVRIFSLQTLQLPST